MQEAHGLLRDALPPEVRDHGAVLAGVLAVQAVQAILVQQQIPQMPAPTRGLCVSLTIAPSSVLLQAPV